MEEEGGRRKKTRVFLSFYMGLKSLVKNVNKINFLF